MIFWYGMFLAEIYVTKNEIFLKYIFLIIFAPQNVGEITSVLSKIFLSLF